MLANGSTLGYRQKGTSTAFADLEGLKELPDIGVDPEKVENTPLSAKVKQYENGVGDAGDMDYKFKYDNSSATSPYRVMRQAAEAGTILTFEHKLVDGTSFVYDAEVSVKVTGGGLNNPVEFTLSMSLQSDITVTDPE